jgi:hypothetical protein
MASRDYQRWSGDAPDAPRGRGRRGSGDDRGNWADGFRRVLTPGGGGTFLDLSVPLFRLAGIRVRLHILFLFIEAGFLLDASAKGFLLWAALGTLATFTLVLIHEFGHCLACRWVGGEADEVLLWPLGGLAFCRPPHRWQADLITTIGGPAVHVLLFPVLALALLACGGSWSTLVLNPLNPFGSLQSLPTREWWVIAIWVLYWKNLSLFAFNMTLVMFPMDAGRVFQGLLWWRLGYHRSMRIATATGFVMACIVGLLGLMWQYNILFMIAIFAGFECAQQWRRLQLMAAEGSFESENWLESMQESSKQDSKAAARAAKAAQAAREQAAKDQAELDRILAKIAAQGMASLTAAEKRWLERETQQRRGA